MYRQSSWESGFSSVLSGGFSGFLTVCPFSQSFGIRIVCFWISCIWFLSMSLRSGVRLLATQSKGKSRRRKSRHSGGRDWESRAVCLEDCFRSAAPTAGCAPGFGELDSGIASSGFSIYLFATVFGRNLVQMVRAKIGKYLF